MKIRFNFLLTVMLLFSLFVVGCSGGTFASDSDSNDSPEKEKKGSKTTIQFWHSMSGKNGEYIDALIQRFNESHDDIEVVGTFQGTYNEAVTKLQQAVASNTAPDIMMVERAFVEMLADSEVLEDLNPYLESSGLSKEDFTEGLLGHSFFNNQLVSLPLNRSTPILHINKTMLDEQGLEIPKNWDELKEIANALVIKEDGKIKRYGYTMPYDTWYPIAMISQANGKFFNDEKTSIGFDENGVGLKVFNYLKELQNTGALYYPPAQDSANITAQMFADGKVGMMYESTGVIGRMQETVDFEYVTAFLPKDEVYATPTGGANIAMMSSSNYKEAAWEFINWLVTDPDGALKFILDSGYLPFTKKMVESEEIKNLWEKEPNRKVAYEQLQYAIDTNMAVAWPEVMQEFFSAIEAVMYDNKDVEQTLNTFKKEAERILAN